ncbi:hypothetical protein Cme02nite_32380 [Catellatospora methionotrophica]|uniref:Uncharacterized protein n=1 Tax=Catellatospora methionotrophica TaxID=121620 RepID=A0A8J3PH17_9ACTN|nr:hypothetical protein [Catellatospora methionotrophica]GIG14906.1 hypothetical protein Cme02nite_32380 [Catellatospora methionotrophica]
MADVNPRKIAGIVLTPVLAVVLLVAGVLATVLGWGLTTGRTMDHADVDWVYLLAAVVVSGLLAAAAYRLAGPLRLRGWYAVLAVLVPAVVFAVLQWDKTPNRRDGGLVWLAGLVVVLAVAAVLARRGMVRAAWIAGVLGAVVIADVAVLVQLMPSAVAAADPAEILDRSYAPLWLVFALVDYDFGLDPATWYIGDALDFRELGYPMYTLIALGFVVRAMRPASEPAIEPVSQS